MKNKIKINKNKTKKNNGKINKSKINKSKYKNKLNKNKTNKIKRGGMTLLYNQIAKATLKMQLNLSLMINTLSKGSMSYEKSLIDYSSAFDRYVKEFIGPKLNGKLINLQNIYNYYTELLQPKIYDKHDKLVILIIFIYKFYSNKLVDKQYYSLWKNKDIVNPDDICEYKYILHEINNLWSNMSRINRMDDYEKIISENIEKIKVDKDDDDNYDDIRTVCINPIEDKTNKKLNDTIIDIKKKFEDEIFNIPNPNPKCKDIKVNYSYYILVILYYIHYTISEEKGNNTLDDELHAINYDDYITFHKLNYCGVETSFITAYKLSKGPLAAAMSKAKETVGSLKSKKGMTDALSKAKDLAASKAKEALSKAKSDLSSNAKGMIDSKATGMANPLAVQPSTAGITGNIATSLLKPK